MSDEEFLARWSRRKREARTSLDAEPPTPPTEASDPAQSGTAENSTDAEVDLSSLPSIESITGRTDITGFLRKGIPPELSREALRRAWASDSAIRDFVGLAENAWDFNDPNAMPGFGPLDCSEAQLSELIERVIGGVSQAAESLANPPTESKDERERADSEGHPAPKSVEAIADVRSTDAATVEGSPQVLAASQPEGPQEADPDQTLVGRRTHGGALPR